MNSGSVSKLAKESDLKSDGCNGLVGSSPTAATILELYPETLLTTVLITCRYLAAKKTRGKHNLRLPRTQLAHSAIHTLNCQQGNVINEA